MTQESHKTLELTIGSNGRPVIDPYTQTLHPQPPYLPPSPLQDNPPVRICIVSILHFFIIDPFMIVFPTVFISDLSDDLSFVQVKSLSLMY